MKNFLESKKERAFYFIEILLFIVMIVGLALDLSGLACSTFLMTIVIGMVFLAAGYIGGQAWLDRWTKIAPNQTIEKIQDKAEELLDNEDN